MEAIGTTEEVLADGVEASAENPQYTFNADNIEMGAGTF